MGFGQVSYSVTDTGTLGGISSEATGINDSGQVVGEADTSAGVDQAFLFSNGSMANLDTLGGNFSEAYGINNNGQVVGWANTGYNTTPKHSCIATVL